MGARKFGDAGPEKPGESPTDAVRMFAERYEARISELEGLARWLYACPVPPKMAGEARARMEEAGL